MKEALTRKGATAFSNQVITLERGQGGVVFEKQCDCACPDGQHVGVDLQPVNPAVPMEVRVPATSMSAPTVRIEIAASRL